MTGPNVVRTTCGSGAILAGSACIGIHPKRKVKVAIVSRIVIIACTAQMPILIAFIRIGTITICRTLTARRLEVTQTSIVVIGHRPIGITSQTVCRTHIPHSSTPGSVIGILACGIPTANSGGGSAPIAGGSTSEPFI